MSDDVLRTDLKLCPDCDEPKLSSADGVLGCTNCGWSEEDCELLAIDCFHCGPREVAEGKCDCTRKVYGG
jgi:hypothetical protein